MVVRLMLIVVSIVGRIQKIQGRYSRLLKCIHLVGLIWALVVSRARDVGGEHTSNACCIQSGTSSDSNATPLGGGSNMLCEGSVRRFTGLLAPGALIGYEFPVRQSSANACPVTESVHTEV